MAGLAATGLIAAALPASSAEAERIDLPSGLSVEVHEILDAGDGGVRARFIAAEFNPMTVDPEVLLADMSALCQGRIAALGVADPVPKRITVSIADRAAEFGVLNTDVRQSFEAFEIADGICIWEAF